MTRKTLALRRAGAIDWAGIHRRLEEMRNAIDNIGAGNPLDSMELERILRERAVALAKPVLPSKADTLAGDRIDILVFQLAGEKYAFDAAYVAQACPVPPVAAVPGAPDYVVGIVAIEGEVLSVIDLRSLLDLSLSSLTDPTAIIVLKNDAMEFCVLAEEIAGMEQVSEGTLQHALPTMGSKQTNYLKGVTADRVAVLDAEQLLSDARLVVDMR
ncbi:chemotaxis protein CheW [Herbaspirillum sp. ST 5-3]|uniref:chemotaxis protein CheW n=1 Tax=Oxalobacteraceae TaxID=75682 RepID=UPI0010A48982|nr:chemotaxis protein CheW [Herbaspirillum sp. ST 5-3]